MADTLNSNIRAFIANENTSISNSNQETLINRHVAVLKNLVSAKRAIAALINVQMAVISLHRMLNEVCRLILIGSDSPAIYRLITNNFNFSFKLAKHGEI